MDTSQEPIDTIKEWQEWYRKHRIVAQMEEPANTQPTEETMSIETNAKAKEMWIEKAKEHFADTLAEYQYELSGKDFYKAFYQAAKENLEAVQKEYERSKELIDMLRYHHLGDN